MKISQRTTALWAKKRSEDGEQYWLPLIVHLIDAQNTINWLFYHWLSPGQRQLLIGTSTDEITQKLVKFTGFVHDLGKATPAFQMKKSYDRDTSLDERLTERLSQDGFIDLNDLILASPNKSPHALAGEAILEDAGVPITIGAIIGGHHGKPADQPPFSQMNDYTANYLQSDNQTNLQIPWRQVQQELLQVGLTSSGFQKVEEIPDLREPQAVVLEGLLIMADWLASSEYLNQNPSEPLFPLIKLDQSWEDVNTTVRFKHAIVTWDLDGNWEPEKIGTDDSETTKLYYERWKFTPRPVQRIMTQAIGQASDPGMVIVEAPMGLGKTEIALLAAEQLAYATGCDGLFMGLPTQATTNAMFARVYKWLQNLSDKQRQNLAIKLMHSKAQFNPEYRELPHAGNVYDLEGDSGSVVVNDWFFGKKSILTKFTVGTIDNLLLMGLKQKHLFLRHLGFSGKVVIIDEVHAYDAYMNQYLYKAISWLGAYHVPIVILSATLPKEKRAALLTAYLRGKYGRKFKAQLVAPTDWRETQAYPLLSLLDGHEIKQVKKFPGQSDQQPQHLQVERLTVDDDALMAHVLDKISHGGIAGVIVNTVKRAQTLAKLVPDDVKLMVLHSAFLANDRTRQEAALQAAIGTQGARPEKMIVIGTQVLEQSLDIDFDVLYTDIAPMDLILQRAGRLHRHQIKRPQALRQPQLFVMGVEAPGEYGKGNEAVYGKYLLMKTDHFLKATVTLPDDISVLVQQVYDPATDAAVKGIEPASEKFAADLKKEKRKAKVFQIGRPDFKAGVTIHDWLGRDLGSVDQDEQKASAAVRDIQETLEVILIQHTAAGNQLLDGRPLAGVQQRKIAQQIIRIPAVVTLGRQQMDRAISELETVTAHYFSDWQSSVWLKGALALPLDQALSATLAGWRLTYSPELGLSYVKEDDHGQ